MKRWLCLFGLYMMLAPVTFAQPQIKLELFSSPYTSPVDIKNCGDGRLFIVQQDGYIYICDSAGNKKPTPFLDVHTKISIGSERGLLGIVFHPDYFTNGYFFIYYTKTSPNLGNIVIARYKVDSLNPDVADPNSADVVIEVSHTTYSNHNGGCLQFGDEGYLYTGTGDGGSGGDPDENAQNTQEYLGKLLRFDVDVDSGYAVPSDNPFVNDPSYYPEIWAIGVRNPWRFSFDRLTHELWIGEVGQSSWEEVDYIAGLDTGGQNYGWDCYEGTHNYEPGNCNGALPVTWPIYEYPHSGGSNPDCSETGGYVYRGCKYLNMYGKYFFADYCSGKVRCITKNANGTFTANVVGDELIASDEYDFSSFGEDRYGELYLADVTHGKIYHVTDTSAISKAIIFEAINDTAVCVGDELNAVPGDSLSYEWYQDDSAIFGATDNSFIPLSSGNYTVNVTNAEGCVTTSKSIYAGDPATVDIAQLDSSYCIFLTSISLSGIPPGGTFSGDGVNGNVFSPNIAGPGSHTIYYTYINQYGCSSIDSQSVVIDTCTGLNGDWDQLGINIFPNPNDGSLSIILKDTNDAITEISVYNMAGQMLFSLSPDQNVNAHSSIQMNLSALSNGIYEMKIVQGGNVKVHKIVISH